VGSRSQEISGEPGRVDALLTLLSSNTGVLSWHGNAMFSRRLLDKQWDRRAMIALTQKVACCGDSSGERNCLVPPRSVIPLIQVARPELSTLLSPSHEYSSEQGFVS
jgi:hypothetical protein